MSLNTLQTIAGLKQSSGGPSRSVTALCNSMAQRKLSVSLLSMEKHDLSDCLIPDQSVVKLHLTENGFLTLFARRSPRSLFKTIKKLHQQSPLHIIHDHGLWLPFNHATAITAYSLKVPYVVSPRGMLSPWALDFKSWKKKIAWNLWVARDLNRVTAFCTTAETEAENLRHLGFRQPIATIPNGINIEPLKYYHEKQGKSLRQALFLSRIHPVKGVCEMVEAWAKVQPEGWELVIAGPDNDGHAKAVHQCIAKYRLRKVIRLIGPINDAIKWKLFQQSDLFVLPTFSENFGIVIAEALSMGTPVITTKGAPWDMLIDHNCGWWIDIGVEPLVQALKEATSLSTKTRNTMGARGRKFVSQSFAWEMIAERMHLFYLWLLNQAEKPHFVRDKDE